MLQATGEWASAWGWGPRQGLPPGGRRVEVAALGLQGWAGGATLLPPSSRSPGRQSTEILTKSILEVIKVSPKICSFSKLSFKHNL